MKILVPVDGSAHSLKALETAADFAKSKQADIYVISVALSIGGMEGHELSPHSRELHDDTQQQRADEAIKTAGEVLKKHEVDVRVSRTLSTSVSIPDAVIDFAKTEQIDLIVLGSRGLSASCRFKLGSIAYEVVKYSPCTVHLVKIPAAQG
jgi:nucleotide-binding universal stress UspA family protein